ncbi:MAG: isoprenylcysteine carboxylmethyltransferase family protein [FCB group bacterium]|nr:isoprenylcysteine carboxylmethyltransferase family protein [FCB group bacterium]
MSLTVRIIIFIILSGGLCWVSRSALGHFHAHGWYRFFAWEAMTALILTNINYWFTAPFSVRQLFSWVLLLLSIFLAIGGFHRLHTEGKHDPNRTDPALKSFEKTSQLVTTGVYRYLRHPLYAALFYLNWGAFFKHPSPVGIALAGLAAIFLILTAKAEEKENRRFFGPAYEEYMTKTKRLIPFVY